MKPLPKSFFSRKTKIVARDLLRKTIVCGKLTAKIIETEAYIGPHDLASHSRFGKTTRNAVMFGPPGIAYIYLVYGLYYCFNVVTEKEGYGAAVLIRATDHSRGPGLLCRDLKIDKRFNGIDLTKIGPLYIADGEKQIKILTTTRVGVDYAGEWKDKPLRFMILSNDYGH